jgi:preprotein translocase subunit YajC
MTYAFEAVVILVLVGLLILARRARGRAADIDARLRRDISVGSHVMTTSGLYGSVVAINSDDTVILAIAPGVEVRWAFAALRDAATLPPRYRKTIQSDTAGATGAAYRANVSADTIGD